MSFNEGPVTPSTRFSASYFGSWGPYWDVMFPQREVSAWINFKRGSTGVNIARRFWAQREYLRHAYEAVYGTDPDAWPSRHPGVVLDAVPAVDHPACLGCQWFGSGGASALILARRHEMSNGADTSEAL